MGNLTNYHSHSLYCDGRAGMEDFVRFALSEGFTSYGFSSHAPLPFSTAWTMEWDIMDDYLSEFHRLKEKYAGRIELYIGLEIDYLNEASNPSIARFRELPLDYRIGSVHLLYNDKGEVVDVDVPADTFKTIVDGHFCGDLEHVVRLYYGRLTRMLELGGFDIVGHADKMHYNAACYRPGLLEEPWYDELVRAYFADITRRRGRDKLQPQPDCFREYLQQLDRHSAQNSVGILKNIGSSLFDAEHLDRRGLFYIGTFSVVD